MVDTIRQIKARSATPDECAREISAWIFDASPTSLVSPVFTQQLQTPGWKRKASAKTFHTLYLEPYGLREYRPGMFLGTTTQTPDANLGETVVGESHAWVEWFTGGFTGHDPTNDQDIGERHVVVGKGRDYNDVPPIRGIYDGHQHQNIRFGWS